MSLLTDNQLKPLIEAGMITPYELEQIRTVNGVKAVSFGLSSCGYDIRLSRTECFMVRGLSDPKNTADNHKVPLSLMTDESGTYYMIPPLTYVLAVTVERFKIPIDVCGIATGKSTYARCGLISFITPLEPGWTGYLTLELFNTSSEKLKIYADEGIAQIQFHKVYGCETPYNSRNGKYMNQSDTPTMAKL